MSPRWLYWPAAAGGGTPWAPSDLADLRAWYDADDASTITETSGLISGWNDKSGGGYHLSSSGADRPTYTASGLGGKSVVTFNATHWLAATTASDWKFLHDSTGSSVFIVLQYTRNDRMAFLWTNSFSSSEIGYTLCNDGADQQYNLVRGASSWAVLNKAASNSMAVNTSYVLGVVNDTGNATAADRSSMRLDGGTETAANAQTGALSTSNPANALQVGRSGSALGNMDGLEGFIAEIVICDAVLADSDREKVEGYLAWKWGLEGNLPGGGTPHPYKNSPP